MFQVLNFRIENTVHEDMLNHNNLYSTLSLRWILTFVYYIQLPHSSLCLGPPVTTSALTAVATQWPRPPPFTVSGILTFSSSAHVGFQTFKLRHKVLSFWVVSKQIYRQCRCILSCPEIKKEDGEKVYVQLRARCTRCLCSTLNVTSLIINKIKHRQFTTRSQTVQTTHLNIRSLPWLWLVNFTTASMVESNKNSLF